MFFVVFCRPFEVVRCASLHRSLHFVAEKFGRRASGSGGIESVTSVDHLTFFEEQCAHLAHVIYSTQCNVAGREKKTSGKPSGNPSPREAGAGSFHAPHLSRIRPASPDCPWRGTIELSVELTQNDTPENTSHPRRGLANGTLCFAPPVPENRVSLPDRAHFSGGSSAAVGLRSLDPLA